MVNVLQVLPSLNLGGVERGTLQIAAFLTARGDGAFVASSGGRLVAELEQSGATHLTLPLRAKNPLAIYNNISALEKIIKQYSIDIVHARSRAPAWSAYFAAKRANVPFITTYHGAYGQGASLKTSFLGRLAASAGCSESARTKEYACVSAQPPFSPLIPIKGFLEVPQGNALKRWYNSIMTRGELVIAPSQFIKKYIITHHPAVNPDKIHVIYRGADVTQFDPATVSPEDVSALKASWNIAEGQKILLFPARLSRWKGHKEAITALKNVSNSVLVFLGEIAGQESYQQELLDYAKSLHCIENIRFVGRCDVMPVAYSAADVVLCPSLKPEAFGRTVTEAQAMGAVVIATNHGGAAETIEDGMTGFHIPLENVEEALAAKIQAIFTMPPEQLVTLKNTAIERVRAQFSLAQMTEQTGKIYDSIKR
jgi:glycosyltransferase involved in cell wall biosynthesis